MGTPRLIRKVIDGTEYTYDQSLDVIYVDRYDARGPLDRTQVSSPVDLCLEVTQLCNMTCRNCFSNSANGRPAPSRPISSLTTDVMESANKVIRISVSGGEPLLHPDANKILRFPARAEQIGFVITTNGTARLDLDDVLADYRWLVAVSLHGRQSVHDAYSRSTSFQMVADRIRRLAPLTVVHIYSVLHDAMDVRDVHWLLQFRDEVGAAFLRFIEPRPFGRYQPLRQRRLVDEVQSALDERSGLKTQPSLTFFHGVMEERRLSH
jgi:molybdenum cofactor biosynthesis enzyme MoaA